jgi:ferric-dicitrate binding protein FerR (iron transport regulator)
MRDEQRPEQMSDPVESLIRVGGRRVEPPDDAYRAVFAAAETALRDKIRRRRWRRAVTWLAMAAAVGTVAIGLRLSLWRPVQPQAEVARVDRLRGHVEWREAGSREWTTLSVPVASLRGGGTLRTGEGAGAGLLYPDESSLRLGPGSEIELTDAWSLTLRSGTLYAATAANRPGRLEVVTPRGRVRHLGTQFEVRYRDSELRLRVREGRVALATDAGGVGVVADAGEELSIGPSGRMERRPIATDDPAWHWTELLSPMPPFDGRSAQALLEWAARETGRELVYADSTAAQRAATVILHGDPGQLAPEAALEVMLATTDLHASVAEGGRIRVVAK